MQLKMTTDYAVNCILYLAKKNRACTSREISDATGVPKNYAQQILGVMRRCGMVRSDLGNKGGYRIAKDPKTISLFDIMEPFEKSMSIHPHVSPLNCEHERDESGRCMICDCYNRIQSALDSHLKNTTVEQLITDEGL